MPQTYAVVAQGKKKKKLAESTDMPTLKTKEEHKRRVLSAPYRSSFDFQRCGTACLVCILFRGIMQAAHAHSDTISNKSGFPAYLRKLFSFLPCSTLRFSSLRTSLLSLSLFQIETFAKRSCSTTAQDTALGLKKPRSQVLRTLLTSRFFFF